LIVKAAGGWSKYKGQILHLNSDFSELYSLSDVDSAYMMLIQSFKFLFKKNTGLRKGFLVLLFITKPFSSDYERRQEFESTIKI
jgi:hypothetical protein